jgi:hypothetical protein
MGVLYLYLFSDKSSCKLAVPLILLDNLKKNWFYSAKEQVRDERKISTTARRSTLTNHANFHAGVHDFEKGCARAVRRLFEQLSRTTGHAFATAVGNM